MQAAAQLGVDADMRELERVVLLRAVDEHWMDHIDAMDQLRQGISLQAIGQKDPVVAYRNAGFDMFDEMVERIQRGTISVLLKVRIEIRTNGAPARPAQTTQNAAPQNGEKTPFPAGSAPKSALPYICTTYLKKRGF